MDRRFGVVPAALLLWLGDRANILLPLSLALWVLVQITKTRWILVCSHSEVRHLKCTQREHWDFNICKHYDIFNETAGHLELCLW